VLRGEAQADRDYVVTEYNENSGGNRHPMRSIVTRDYAYIFNPWSNGSRVMATATKGTETYRRMQALAPTNPQIAERLRLFDRRVPEELYNYANDPDALNNLIDKPSDRPQLDRLTTLLEAWMVKTGDPMLAVFRQRADPKAREAYMVAVEKEAEDRRTAGTGKPKNERRAGRKQRKGD
jgi:N-sulfoglucosamine sulfohydrolase